MRQQLRAHKAPSPSVPSLPRCAAHAPAPAPAPAPTFYHSGGPRDEASGSPVVKRRARGQRADMPTAPPRSLPFPSLPSPTAHCDCDACCRHGDFPWSRILTVGLTCPRATCQPDRPTGSGPDRLVRPFVFSSRAVHSKIVDRLLPHLLLSQTRLQQ